MLTEHISSDLKQYAWDVVSNKDFGTRLAGFNGTKENQFVGILGEVFIYKTLHNAFPNFEKFSFTDVLINGKRFDVKTMGRTVSFRPDFVHNFVAYQESHDVDGYIFCSINKPASVIEVCGWIHKGEFFETAELIRAGQIRHRADGSNFVVMSDLYELPNKFLNPINTRNDLLNVGITNYLQ